MLGDWAYGAIYRTSSERTNALDGWLYHYNHQRPQRALGRQTPPARLTELNRNNVLGSYK
jgi:transposase InsO family protein